MLLDAWEYWAHWRHAQVVGARRGRADQHDPALKRCRRHLAGQEVHRGHGRERAGRTDPVDEHPVARIDGNVDGANGEPSTEIELYGRRVRTEKESHRLDGERR